MQRLTDATRELNAKSQKLERALQKEKELNQMQRQFVSMASHEFRTPLAIIDSTAQRLLSLLHKPDKDDACKKKITKIRNSVERLSSLIESTLAVEAIDSGKTEFNVKACDIHSLIAEVCERQQEISHSHTIKSNLDDLPGQIIADEGRLDQIFTNILSNAVKYSPEADSIDVRGWVDADHVVIVVSDQGLGIPEAEIEQIYDRFFRASSACGIVGTGIGLFLVREFVALHNGSVDVKSTEGKGTTFTIRIPISPQVDASEKNVSNRK